MPERSDTSIHENLTGSRLDMPALAAYLDSLDQASRVRETRTLSGREQARLFDAAAGVRPIALGDLVPPDVPPFVQVIHHGRNYLPSSTRSRNGSAGRLTTSASSGGTTSTPCDG